MALAVLDATTARVLFIENGYASLGIESPAWYRRWDMPVVRAVAAVARKRGALLHVHQHGARARERGEDVDVAAGAALAELLSGTLPS
jgi:hypothetical protein